MLGEESDAALDLETLTARHPLRERLWYLRAVALYRLHRRAEALHVLRQLSDSLVEDLGIEPSRQTRTLQHQILHQDAALLGLEVLLRA